MLCGQDCAGGHGERRRRNGFRRTVTSERSAAASSRNSRNASRTDFFCRAPWDIDSGASRQMVQARCRQEDPFDFLVVAFAPAEICVSVSFWNVGCQECYFQVLPVFATQIPPGMYLNPAGRLSDRRNILNTLSVLTPLL